MLNSRARVRVPYVVSIHRRPILNMKKYILFLALFFLPLSPHAATGEEPVRRGLFVSVIQDTPVFSSREEIVKLVDFARRAHIETLFVQVYRANQAWFPSKIADPTPYEKCLKALSEDPFYLLIRSAHDNGIKVHAWLNMLSLSVNQDAPLLRKYGTGILTRNLKKKKKLSDYKIDHQYFLEPGDLRVRKELSLIVEEIVRSYPDLDGVQFDYVRYPDKDPAYGYTTMNTERFKKATSSRTIVEGSQAWNDWKRAQVTATLEYLVKRTRSLRPGIRVSATGCMPYSRAYYEAFQDWPSWLDRGLVDFVTIMSYSPDPSEFKRWVSGAKKKTGDFTKVNIGVGAYKMGRTPGAFEQELQFCNNAGCGSCVIFHYGSLLRDTALAASLTASDTVHK